MGDLVEQYQQGQTSSWYWNQTFIAIVRGMFSEIARHRWLTIRAIALGWVLLVVLDFARRVPFRVDPFVISSHPVLQLIIPFLIGAWIAASGWVVARFSGAHHSAAVLFFAGSFMLYRSIPDLAKFLMVFSRVDSIGRTASVVDFLVLFPLQTILPALLIMKGGGLLTASAAGSGVMVDENEDARSRA
jgi:hypothetical protein